MRGACRYCGAVAQLRLVGGFTVCDDCANSPLCDECGHPRADHTRVFVRRGRPGCSRRISDFQSLSSERCGCAGFRPIAGPLRDAAFADADPDPLELGLRVVGRPPA